MASDDGDDATLGARRVLHSCWVCADADAVADFLEAAFDLTVVMRSDARRVDGSLLGIDGQMTTMQRFVYDARGPRTSPAIEVQGWLDPPVTGEAPTDAAQGGAHAVGIGVGDLDATLARLEGLGFTTVGRAEPARELFGTERAAVVRGPEGVPVDLVEDRTLGDDTRLRHLRITCHDLDRSVAWYGTIGAATVARHTATEVTTSDAFGVAPDTEPCVDAAHLRLPDEPFLLVLHQWRAPATHGAPAAVPWHRGIYRAALGFDDTRASRAALGEQGVEFVREPTVVRMSGGKVPDMWIAFAHDPDGFPIELVERPRSAFRA